jgi:hypothetical protein
MQFLGFSNHEKRAPRQRNFKVINSLQHVFERWVETIGVLGFDLQWGLGIFLFTTVSTMALGPTQPPIQCVPGALSLGVKQLGHEADHSPPSSAEVNE